MIWKRLLKRFGNPGMSALAASLVLALVCRPAILDVSRLRAAQPAAESELTVLEEQAFKGVAALLNPSIVQIQTVGGLDRVGGINTGTAPTTGVIVSDDGYIITSAFNFAAKPASTLVILPDGRRFPATIVAHDQSRMLTLLKIEAANLEPAPAADSSAVQVGQWAIALGRTYSVSYPSISVGVVSALDRVWGRAIQTDAKVSPINYGGPLADVEGRVIGILAPLSPKGNTETAGVEWYDSGIGFAVPLDDVYRVLDRLKSGEELKPGLLGITFQGRTDFARPQIDVVRPLSPADEAGLESGDVIVGLDERRIVRVADLKHALGPRYAGETVEVHLERGEQSVTAAITLAAELPDYEFAYLGVLPERVPTVSSDPPVPGLALRHVFVDSPADQGGLRETDRITALAETAVDSVTALRDRLARVQPGDQITLTILRDGAEQKLEITAGSYPGDVVKDLPPVPIPPSNQLEAAGADAAADAAGTREGADEGLRTGRFNVKLDEYEHEYWAYVPEHYNPDYAYGLLVWIHPAGDTMEAEMIRAWQSICERRGLIIVAPKADQLRGWQPEEATFVVAAVEDVMSRYSIDPQRVFVHSFENGGRFAAHVAFKERERFRGVALASAPLLQPPPPTSPEFRLQFHFNAGTEDSAYERIQATVDALQRLKYPVSLRTTEGRKDKYPAADDVEEIGRWADSLDRL